VRAIRRRFFPDEWSLRYPELREMVRSDYQPEPYFSTSTSAPAITTHMTRPITLQRSLYSSDAKVDLDDFTDIIASFQAAERRAGLDSSVAHMCAPCCGDTVPLSFWRWRSGSPSRAEYK